MLPGFDNNQPLCLRLDVVAYQNRPPTEKIACIFAQRGGKLGRATENDLVLSDPEGVVSRVHAEIEFRDGDYVLTDKSTNGTFINDAPDRLAAGSDCLIRDGDKILIGDYLIAARLVVLDEQSEGENLPGTDDRLIDPGEPESVSDPFGEHEEALGKFAERDGWSSDARRPEWFPKGEDDVSRVKTSPTGIEPVHEQAPVPIMQQHMPQPARPAAEVPDAQASDARAASDKQHAPGTRVPTGYVPFADQFEGFPDGKLLPDEGAEVSIAPQVSDADITQSADEEPTGAPDTQAGIDSGAQELRPSMPPRKVRASSNAVEREVHGASEGDSAQTSDAQLLAAFLRGLDVSALRVTPDQAPEFMEQMGRMVHEAAQGMIDTLRLRAEFKREFYVPATSIAPVDNNLFKYSVNVEDAMSRLMSDSGSAYMGAAESTQRAFQDVAAHHLALIAGMQAATSTLLERFSPVALHERIGKASVLEGVLPQVRKARMWEEFEKEYQQIADQAAEDFQEIFGQNFSRAYTEQIRRLERAGFGGKNHDNEQS